MNKIVFDTCIYVPWIREGNLAKFADRNSEKYVYLSVIVAQELYAGAKDSFTQKSLHHFYSVFKKLNSLITPSEEEWMECGLVLGQIGKKYGYDGIRKSRLVNDVLIALSCRRIEATLITLNMKDFRLIQEFVKFELGEG